MMSNLVFVATCDLAGKVRGKAFPVDDLDRRLARGVGWTPVSYTHLTLPTIYSV